MPDESLIEQSVRPFGKWRRATGPKESRPGQCHLARAAEVCITMSIQNPWRRRARARVSPMTCACSRCIQPYTRTRRWQTLCPKCDRDLDRAAAGRGEQFTLFSSEVNRVRS